MIRTEFENLKSYFKVLQDRMAERDEDCAEPKNAVDKGYSLAISHMNSEIETILHELEMQIFPASDKSKKMNKFSNIDDYMLFHRLDEIDGELQDWHISAYKSDLITNESNEIKSELKRRGYTRY